MNLNDLPQALQQAANRFDDGVVFEYLGPRDDASNDLLTRSLENNLFALESLRDDIDRAGMKDLPDVREFGNTSAGVLLRGYESTIDYSDLLALITTYKRGLAARYLA